MKYYRLTLVGYDLCQHAPCSCKVLHDMHPNVHAAAQAAYNAAAQEIVELARSGLPYKMPYSFSLNFNKGESPACTPACIMIVDCEGNVFTYSEYQVHQVEDLHLGTKREDTEWSYRGFIIQYDKKEKWYYACPDDSEPPKERSMSGHSLRTVLDIIDTMLAEALG